MTRQLTRSMLVTRQLTQSMRRRAKTLKDGLYRTVDRFIEAEAYRLAASLSFYALSSIFPLLLVALSIGEMVLGDQEAPNAPRRHGTARRLHEEPMKRGPSNEAPPCSVATLLDPAGRGVRPFRSKPGDTLGDDSRRKRSPNGPGFPGRWRALRPARGRGAPATGGAS